MAKQNTLRTISKGLSLHPDTLGVVMNRADHAGKPRPQPVDYIGPNNGTPLYDVDEVEAWYVARSFDPKPKRGPDKTQRTRSH